MLKIQLICVSYKQDDWVIRASQEYIKRLPQNISFVYSEIKPVSRMSDPSTTQVSQILREEKEKILLKTKPSQRLFVLDEKGQQFDTRNFAKQLNFWQLDGRAINLVIGSADGLDVQLKEEAELKISLSPFTLPHGLARIIICEQLYRACSINAGHPYHRD